MDPVPCLQAFPKPLKNTVRAVTGLPQGQVLGSRPLQGQGRDKSRLQAAGLVSPCQPPEDNMGSGYKGPPRAKGRTRGSGATLSTVGTAATSGAGE